MRIYFLMRHADYVRNFEWVVRSLAHEGHSVHLAFERGRRNPDLAQRLAAETRGAVTFGFAPVRWDVWQPLAWSIGGAIDYLRYFDEAYSRADFLRLRAEARTPALVARLARTPFRPLLRRALELCERAIPVLPELAQELERTNSDVLMVTPLVSEHSQHDFARSVRAAGRPFALAVHSWDNLTNKGLVRETPDRTYVWNEIQRREAIDLHGLPPESVLAVGAHSYDHWFEWEPSRDRDTFCREVGLDALRPFLLYVGSSLQIAPDERPLIRRWIEALRRDPVLQDVGVLVRPHPYSGRTWDDDPFADLTDVVVFPPRGAEPRDDLRRADYYDSIHHAAAVVGLNTTALIEAAIVGRRTYTWVQHEQGNTQEGTLHFHYLLRENGGPLVAASTLDAHVADLRRAVDNRDSDDWRHSFVRTFIRPRGLDLPAAPLFADDLLMFGAAQSPRAPGRRPPLLTAILFPFAWFHYVRLYGRYKGRSVRVGDDRPSRSSLTRQLRQSARRGRKRARKSWRRTLRAGERRLRRLARRAFVRRV
jgi:hypothetical protein